MGAKFDKKTYTDLLLTKLRLQDGTGVTYALYASGATGATGFARKIERAPDTAQRLAGWPLPAILVKDGPAKLDLSVGSVSGFVRYTQFLAIVSGSDTYSAGNAPAEQLEAWIGTLMSFLVDPLYRHMGTGRIVDMELGDADGTKVLGDESRNWHLQELALIWLINHTL